MIPVAVGGAFVRMGNLFNHEIYGHPTDRPWGFRFIENVNAWMNGAEPVYGPPSHPTQIYEALAYLVLFALLCYLYYRKDAGRRYPGLLFGVGLIGIFLSRFLIEYVKNDQVDFEATMFLNMGQWLSVPVHHRRHRDDSLRPASQTDASPARRSTGACRKTRRADDSTQCQKQRQTQEIRGPQWRRKRPPLREFPDGIASSPGKRTVRCSISDLKTIPL